MKPGFLLLFLISTTVVGQDISFGLKTGLTVSYIKVKKYSDLGSYNPDADIKNCLYFQFGFYSNFHINQSSGIIVEPGFIQKGVSFKNIHNSYKFNHQQEKLRLGYIDLPILYYFNFLNKCNFEIGPEIGYRVKEKLGDYNYSTYELQNNWDFGFIVNLSYNVNNLLTYGIGYSCSFTKMEYNDYEFSHIIGSENYNYRNRYFEIFIRFHVFDYE